MGKTIEGPSGQTTKLEPNQNGKANGNSSTGPTQSEGPGTGTGKETGVPKLVVVDIPGAEKETDPPKRGRGRPPGSGKKNTPTKTAAAKKKGGPVDTTHLKILIKTVSDIIASKPGMAMWSLSMEEIEAIGDPLSKVLERHSAVSELTGEYGDYMALVVVSFTIFLPKYLMYQAMKPKKEGKTDARPRLQGVPNESRASAKPNPTVDRENYEPATAGGENFGGKLFELVPTLM